MGLLDDLEQEAQRRKASLDDVERVKAERETAYKTVLETAMQAFHEYLVKLTTSLAYLKPKTQIRHEIPGYGTVVANIDHEYDLKANAITPQSREITLFFSATVATEQCPTVAVLGANKIRTLNAAFQKVRLSGVAEFKKDESGEMISATFRPRGKIPLNVTIAADAESGTAKLNFTNFDELATLTKSATPAQFTEQLFDQVGKYIAREENNLFREALPDDFRKQLAQKVQQEQLKRKWESKIAQQQIDEVEQLKREHSLKGRLDKAVKDVSGKAPSILEKMKGIFKKP